MVVVDGAWRALSAHRLWGESVVFFRQGRLLGCDLQYAFQGTYRVGDDGIVTAHLEVEHYVGEPRTISCDFGTATLTRYVADLESVEVGEKVIVLEGLVNQSPGMTLKVRLERLIPLRADAKQPQDGQADEAGPHQVSQAKETGRPARLEHHRRKLAMWRRWRYSPDGSK